jgi:hypothetical protein
MGKSNKWDTDVVAEIALLIEDTIPDPSEISVVDAVRLLVRENNVLRQMAGLPTYAQVRRLEDLDL